MYGIFKEFGKFYFLFLNFGCLEFVILGYYVMVLDLLYKRCYSFKLDLNVVNVCERVVRGFFNEV